MNSIKFIARFAATAALIAGVSSQVAAQGSCPVNAQCTVAGWMKGVPVTESDSYGPQPAPFPANIQLEVPQFNPATYAALHGVTTAEIELVAVELQVTTTINTALVYFKNQNPTNPCGGTWAYEIVTGIEANTDVNTPAVEASVNESGSTGTLDPGEEYTWNLPSPDSESACVSFRVQDGDLSPNWIGAGNVTFDTASAAQDTDGTGCGDVLKQYSNTTTQLVEVTYHYCFDGIPDDPEGCLCLSPSDHYRVPGSLLLFPEFDNRDGDISVLTVTNVDCIDSGGGDVEVHYVYIDEDGCDEFDKNAVLTPCDTLTVLTNVHSPEHNRGYVYVYAQDPVTHEPIVWNHLIGSLLVISGLDTFDYGINPVAFRGLTGVDGTPTDVDEDGNRDLNNVEYAGAPDVITIPRFLGQDFEAGPGTIHSEMILIALSGGKLFDTEACFLYYNDNEEEFSGVYTFHCWDKPNLLDMSFGFANDWLEDLVSDDPDEILGIPDPGYRNAGWICIQGCFAYSTRETIEDPSIYAVLVEHVGNWGVADLPFECGVRINGSLIPDNVYGDGDGPSDPPKDGDNK